MWPPGPYVARSPTTQSPTPAVKNGLGRERSDQRDPGNRQALRVSAGEGIESIALGRPTFADAVGVVARRPQRARFVEPELTVADQDTHVQAIFEEAVM